MANYENRYLHYKIQLNLEDEISKIYLLCTDL
jgi:hypothetical protein